MDDCLPRVWNWVLCSQKVTHVFSTAPSLLWVVLARRRPQIDAVHVSGVCYCFICVLGARTEKVKHKHRPEEDNVCCCWNILVPSEQLCVCVCVYTIWVTTFYPDVSAMDQVLHELCAEEPSGSEVANLSEFWSICCSELLGCCNRLFFHSLSSKGRPRKPDQTHMLRANVQMFTSGSRHSFIQPLIQKTNPESFCVAWIFADYQLILLTVCKKFSSELLGTFRFTLTRGHPAGPAFPPHGWWGFVCSCVDPAVRGHIKAATHHSSSSVPCSSEHCGAVRRPLPLRFYRTTWSLTAASRPPPLGLRSGSSRTQRVAGTSNSSESLKEAQQEVPDWECWIHLKVVNTAHPPKVRRRLTTQRDQDFMSGQVQSGRWFLCTSRSNQHLCPCSLSADKRLKISLTLFVNKIYVDQPDFFPSDLTPELHVRLR